MMDAGGREFGNKKLTVRGAQFHAQSSVACSYNDRWIETAESESRTFSAARQFTSVPRFSLTPSRNIYDYYVNYSSPSSSFLFFQCFMFNELHTLNTDDATRCNATQQRDERKMISFFSCPHHILRGTQRSQQRSTFLVSH